MQLLDRKRNKQGHSIILLQVQIREWGYSRCITNCIGYSLIQGVQCENLESKLALVDGRTHNSVEIDHIEKKWQLMLQTPQKVSMIQTN